VPTDPACFAELVQDALAHLYDYGYLQVHPLVGSLLPARPPAPGRALHALLREAMEGLRPPHETPGQAPAWRAYRCLRLRYQEMLTMPRVADELGISPRQCRRAHHEALAAVSTLLWARRQTLDPAEPGEEPGSLLEREAARLAQEPGAGAAELSEVVRGVVAMLEPLAVRQGGRLEVRPLIGLPPVAMGRTTLRQALLAALHHAIGWAGAGEVILAAEVAGPAVELIARARRTAGPQPQDDAHLTVARQLLETAGGSLVAGADEGELELRLALPAPRSLTALIVDDNPDALRLARRYLSGSGYRVLVAGDGREALALAADAEPDVIALDVMIPDQDGWEILQTLRSHPRTAAIPVVVCSVLPERELALMLGAADFLPKPFSQRELLEALGRCGLGAPAAPATP